MSKTTRREFVRRASIGVATLSTLKFSPAMNAAAGGKRTVAIPPHQPVALSGVHAYPMDHSVAAGGTLELCVSSSVAYNLKIRRLGVEVDDRSSDQIAGELGLFQPSPQAIHPGSYVHVERSLRGSLNSISLECWVRPFALTGLQGLISQEDKDSSDGFALGIGKDGYIGLFLGDGVSPDEAVVHRTKPGVVSRDKWHHIVGTWDGVLKTIYVDGIAVASWEFKGPLKPGRHALRLGAMSQTRVARHFLDGDLSMAVIYSRALSPQEITARFAERGLIQPAGKAVHAVWTFSEEQGDFVRDVSGKGRHGRIINHGTWMIGGPAFQANVARFGSYDPGADATRGHGLRLASDDLYDCGWAVSHRWAVPHAARSGIYVADFEYDFEGRPRHYYCTFIVRRSPRRKRAPILFVCATNTWRAYSGTPFAVTAMERKQVWGTGGTGRDLPGMPSYCLYRGHAAGQGTYQLGLRMPWPAAGPHVLYGGATEYSHLMRADRFPQTWLEKQGYSCDVISDLDLHRDPSILRGYKVFMIVGHNEYWSREMYQSVEGYLRNGGNLLVLSGNTMGWRVSFSPDHTIMECRKVDCPGDQVPKNRRGEAWHSHDGLRGGPQRECGMPGYRVIGLDIIGWNNQANPKNFGPYVVDNSAHPFFNTPELSGLKNGDSFGWAGPGLMPMANGHEMDIRPSTFAALQQEPSPVGAVVPQDPPGMVRIANGVLPWKEGGQAMDYFFRVIKPKWDQGAEMIYWERPEGGKVFNAGAIGSGWVLHSDPRWATVVRNVLHHFGVTRSA